jgi:thioredoxin reductase (NADPH)
VDSTGKAGGLIREARLIENYPGLEVPLSGEAFAEKLISFLSLNDLEVERFHADSIAGSEGKFETSGCTGSILSRSVIIAAGTVAKEFHLRTEDASVIHRSIHDLKADTPERVLIIGGGEAALDYALNLSDSGSSVRILVRGQRLKASGRLRDRVVTHRRIEILYNTVPVAVTGADRNFHLEARSPEGGIILKADAVLAAVGREPQLPHLMNGFSHEIGGISTSIRGLYLVGDASLGSLGQAGIAVGQGIQAAVSAKALLKAGSRSH